MYCVLVVVVLCGGMAGVCGVVFFCGVGRWGGGGGGGGGSNGLHVSCDCSSVISVKYVSTRTIHAQITSLIPRP